MDFTTQALNFSNINDCFTLNDGCTIPCVGFGTWRVRDNENGSAIVLDAIKAGYRHFDTAALYKSEQSVGDAVKASKIKRSEFFITTKVWKNDLDPRDTRKSFMKSIKNLDMDYVDLLLIHWPRQNYDKNWQEKLQSCWQEFVNIKKEGLAKSIGVSNFMPHHLDTIMNIAKPSVNQLEFHIGYNQEYASTYSMNNDILVEAWSPLGQRRLFDNKLIKSFADKYQVTIPQLCIRYCLQRGVLALPKSASFERMKDNQKVFDFNISKLDMSYLRSLYELGYSKEHPDFNIPQEKSFEETL